MINLAGEFGVRHFESVANDYINPRIELFLNPKDVSTHLILFEKYNYSTLKHKIVKFMASKILNVSGKKLSNDFFENPSLITELMINIE